jgi:hypothetical protein
MPLGTKLTQNDSNAIFEMDLTWNWNKDLYKLIEKIQRQFSRIKKSLNVGND